MEANKKTVSRLDRLKQRQSQLTAQIKKIEATERKKLRKKDTRRKILAGALALEHAAKDAQFAATLDRLIREGLTRNVDRGLFGLPLLDNSDQ